MDVPWKVIFAFIGVFIAGSVFGGFFALGIGQQFAARERPARKFETVPPQPPVGTPLATQLLRRFAEQLDLTNEQRDKLKPIVARAEEQIARIRQRSLEETDPILRQVQQDFRAELTPDQRRKLDRMQKAQNDRMKLERQKRVLQQQTGFGPGQPGQPNPNPQRQRPQNQSPQNYGPSPENTRPEAPAPPRAAP